jgi:hypothetical protein
MALVVMLWVLCAAMSGAQVHQEAANWCSDSFVSKPLLRVLSVWLLCQLVWAVRIGYDHAGPYVVQFVLLLH